MEEERFANKINVCTIKRFDPSIKNIIATASHVALYTFNSDTAGWTKSKVDGVCFIYSRSEEPNYKIFILNRLNMENFMESVHINMEIQLYEPFLLFRNDNGAIYGVWFYDKNEFIHAKTILEKINENLMKKCIPEIENKSSFNGKCDTAPKNVKMFFDNFGIDLSKQNAPSENSNNTHPPLQSFDHSVHSVEYIEKLQRLDKFKECSSSNKLDDTNTNTKNDNNESDNVSKNAIGSLNIPEIISLTSFMPISKEKVQICSSSEVHKNPEKCKSLNNHTISSNSEVKTFSPEVFFSKIRGENKLKGSTETTKPAAISQLQSDIKNCINNRFILHNEEKCQKIMSPLTKSQLLEAMTYMLTNDAEFTDKLYEAYIKSVTH